jgi:hypothetical protein
LTVAEHLVDVEQFRGKDVIAAIDFHHTIIYAADATPGQRPMCPSSPDGFPNSDALVRTWDEQ